MLKPGLEIFSREVASTLSSPLIRFTSEFGMDQVVPDRSRDRTSTQKVYSLTSEEIWPHPRPLGERIKIYDFRFMNLIFIHES